LWLLTTMHYAEREIKDYRWPFGCVTFETVLADVPERRASAYDDGNGGRFRDANESTIIFFSVSLCFVGGSIC